jgi:molybdate transport system substrate-binding protein
MRFVFAVLLSIMMSGQEPPITVSAAISLSGALEEIARAYKASGGGEVRFNFAASNVLARQIVNGAPADLFVSADEAQMDYAQGQGAIDAASRVRLLANRLVVVVPAGRAAEWRDIKALLRPDVRRLALGDPAGVPAGVYARQYFERVGIWHDIQPKLLPLANVRAALAAVESGGADAAVVYESDAATTTRVRVVLAIEGPDAPHIVYPAAITTRSKNLAAARRFLAYLRGSDATSIFQRHRFAIPR